MTLSTLAQPWDMDRWTVTTLPWQWVCWRPAWRESAQPNPKAGYHPFAIPGLRALVASPGHGAHLGSLLTQEGIGHREEAAEAANDQGSPGSFPRSSPQVGPGSKSPVSSLFLSTSHCCALLMVAVSPTVCEHSGHLTARLKHVWIFSCC